MVSHIVLAVCVMVAVASAVPAQPGGGAPGWGPGGLAGGWAPPGAGAWGPPGAVGGANPFIPPWVASAAWFPQFSGPCSAVGATCLDCNTKEICTKIGSLRRPCTADMPYCNLGECSATPSAECTPAVPASVGAA